MIGRTGKSIIVDRSPPIPGHVYDGDNLKKDISFQSSSSQYCANLNGFGDPESGLSMFIEWENILKIVVVCPLFIALCSSGQNADLKYVGLFKHKLH